ncbi:MAG TPA: permease [Acidimicrobiales bacterium]|nr:permease [Acidimicrobiales bacterium]
MSVLHTIGRALAESGAMVWDTLWALVLGFALSGVVQAFVSRAQLRRALGDHAPPAVARASLLGCVSSSCSYAASAMAKSLFARGADFTSAMIFMVASTNLVVELGLVLWLLIGWQFAAAEFVGGTIMVVLLAVVVPRVVPGPRQDRAREALASGGQGHQGAADVPVSRPGSLAGWADAAGYMVSDLTMLRTELVIGFLVAGLLAVVVPTSVWQGLFITGHGVWSSLENVVLGPFLALISFVCSVGNVPLAAALWSGGISFGGVVAFVFADLITIPLLLIYRKYYGTGITLRLLGVFWAVMSLAGLATEYLFVAAGIVPTAHPGVVVATTWRWNYTTVLDLVALAVFAGLYALYRNRERLGGGRGYARDPVCGMQVEQLSAPASRTHAGSRWFFCSDACAARFDRQPDRFAGPTGAACDQEGPTDRSGPEGGSPRDPVCHMSLDPAQALRFDQDGRSWHFCSPGCRDAFVAQRGPSRSDGEATTR